MSIPVDQAKRAAGAHRHDARDTTVAPKTAIRRFQQSQGVSQLIEPAEPVSPAKTAKRGDKLDRYA